MSDTLSWDPPHDTFGTLIWTDSKMVKKESLSHKKDKRMKHYQLKICQKQQFYFWFQNQQFAKISKISKRDMNHLPPSSRGGVLFLARWGDSGILGMFPPHILGVWGEKRKISSRGLKIFMPKFLKSEILAKVANISPPSLGGEISSPGVYHSFSIQN